MVQPIDEAAVTVQAVWLWPRMITSHIVLSIQVGRRYRFGERGRLRSGATCGSGAKGRPVTLRGQRILLGQWLRLRGQGSGRGWHDMCSGYGDLTADGLERGAAAAGTAEILKEEMKLEVNQEPIPHLSIYG